jgi:hypothetical protein
VRVAPQQRRSGFNAVTWDDSSVFGELETSVGRLSECLHGLGDTLDIVTHSFGDWLFRQVAARGAADNVTKLVSLVPVMDACTAARLVSPLGGLAPELAVMASKERAAAALQTPPGMERLIVWSRFDPWVNRVATEHFTNTRCIIVAGTHNTLLWQPRVHRLVVEHFRSEGG